MRRSILFLLTAAVIAGTIIATVAAGTITSVSGSVSDANGTVSVGVTRRGGTPPTYVVRICKPGNCNDVKKQGGEYWVSIGQSKIHFKKLAGGWGYRVKSPNGAWTSPGYTDVDWVPTTVNGQPWCCMTTKPLTDTNLGGNPASGTPQGNETAYTVTFGIDGVTGSGSLSWTETNA